MFRTTLVVGEAHLSLQQMAVSGAFEWRATRAWSLQFSAGGLFRAHLGDVQQGGGGVVGVAASYLLLDQAKWWPFVQLSGSVSFSAMQADYRALDFRAGVVAGYTILERVTPYLAARAFGGPVFTLGTVGTDLYHYQFGVGLVVGLPKGLDLSAELVPLGEQRLTAAVGYSF